MSLPRCSLPLMDCLFAFTRETFLEKIESSSSRAAAAAAAGAAGEPRRR